MTGKKVLVAGGAGFIGAHLCARLLREGCEVWCVDNLSTGRRENIAHFMGNPNFHFVQHDVTEPIVFEWPLDCVVHLASPASPRDYMKFPLETLLAGTMGTRNLLELAKKKTASFLLASSSEIYGDPDVHPQPEHFAGRIDPVSPRAVYSEAKCCAETLTMTYQRTLGLETKIARIFNTYGPLMRQDDGRVISNFCTQALANEPLTVHGDGQQTRSFCFIDDMVEGLLKLLAAPHSKTKDPINLGNPREITILALAHLVLKLTGSSSKIIFQEPLPSDPRRRCPDITLAKKILGWEPRTTLEKGLENFISWQKANQSKRHFAEV